MKKSELLNFELTERIKQSDEVAFQLVFKLYHVQLCHFAGTYVKHLDIADEIVQETFIKVWEVRSILDPHQSLKAFLYRCVHNNCVNYIKKVKVSSRLSEDYIREMKYRMQILEQNDSDDLFEKMAEDKLESAVQKAIDELPQQCREIFLLCRFKGLSYQQTADKLSISVNTVKTQLSRAMQKIRSAMEQK